MANKRTITYSGPTSYNSGGKDKTTGGLNVFSDGKLAGSFGTAKEAQDFYNTLLTNPNNVAGDTGGATYRANALSSTKMRQENPVGTPILGTEGTQPDPFKAGGFDKQNNASTGMVYDPSPTPKPITGPTNTVLPPVSYTSPDTSLPSDVLAPPPVSQNTSGIDSTNKNVNKTANDLLGNLANVGDLNPDAYSTVDQTQAGVDANKRIKDAEDARKTITTEEQKTIDAAAEKARSLYEPRVTDAEESKKQGTAKSTVNAGQRGGFLNTQFAGLAALLPTEGGSFVGAGGELERIASSYDRNIAEAKNTLNVQMEDARSKALEAIQSNEEKDLTDAVNAYERARVAHNDYTSLLRQKQQDTVDFAIKARELQKYEREDVSTTLGAMIADGTKIEDVPEWYFQALDEKGGYAQGTSQGLFKAQEADYALKTATDAATINKLQVESATALQSALANLPAGTPVQIDGHTYYGTQGTGSIEINDSTGRAFTFRVNQSTGALEKQDLGYVGSPKDGFTVQVDQYGRQWNYNPTTGEKFPLDATSSNWGAQLPLGEVYVSPTPGADGQVRAGQCGVFANDMTGIGFGDSLDDKKTKIDYTIGSEENPVQVGDAFVQDIGGWTGHVGVVESVRMDGDKIAGYTIVDCNRNLDGKLGTSFIPAGDPSLVGFARGQVAPILQTGTDSQTFGPQRPIPEVGTYEPQFAQQPLTKEEKDKIAASPDVKVIKSISKMDDYLTQFKELVTTYGIETIPTKVKSQMERLQTLMQLEQKTISELGVLAGPDLGLIEQVIPDATTNGFFAGAGRALTAPINALGIGRTHENVISDIDNLQAIIRGDKEKTIGYLSSQYQGREQDPFLQQLFGTSAPGSGGGFTLNLPDGTSATFATQADLDKFKQENNL